MVIQAGELRHRVTLKRPNVGATNSFGESTEAMEPYAIVWAKVMQERPGVEIREGGQVVAKSPYTLAVRYRADIETEDIADFDGKLLQITSVRDWNGKRESLFLECNEYAGRNV